MKKQAQMAAWAGGPEDAIRFIRSETSLDCLIFSRPDANMEQHGWVRVGLVNAEVVELKSENQLVQEAIAALRSKKSKIYAEAEEAAMGVEARIQQLLAIEDKSAVVATPTETKLYGKRANSIIIDGLIDDDIHF